MNVNTMPARAALRVKTGDVIEIDFPGNEEEGWPVPVKIASQTPFQFFYKPPGLHTVHVMGGAAKSLEDFLPRLTKNRKVELLQRLDFFTGGIVCATETSAGKEYFKKLEREGKCEKRYIAILEGKLEKPMTIRNSLGTNGGKRVTINKTDAESLFWTDFSPVMIKEEALRKITGAQEDITLTLVECRIKKGKRHQIRAHAKAAGFPLFGDPVYGTAGGNGFFLLHYLLTFPDYLCSYVPEGSWAAGLAGEK